MAPRFMGSGSVLFLCCRAVWEGSWHPPNAEPSEIPSQQLLPGCLIPACQ